jgi:hypothetical protein
MLLQQMQSKALLFALFAAKECNGSKKGIKHFVKIINNLQ